MTPYPLKVSLGKEVKTVDTYTDAQGDPQYYVVNLVPDGFVIVSADDLLEPIIAFVPQGQYDPSTENPLGALIANDVPGRLDWVRAVKPGKESKEIRIARDKRRHLEVVEAAGSSLEYGMTGISEVRVAPLVQTRWSQTTVGGVACYNYYTPPNSAGSAANYPCGCVATAMAQLMKYHQHPVAGVGTTSFSVLVDDVPTVRNLRGGDGNGSPYDWANMPFTPTNPTTTQRQAIGALTHDAGIAVQMFYYSGGSATDTLRARDALVETFGYSNARSGFNNNNSLGAGLTNMINPNLDAGLPVLLGITGGPGGHAIVCDGYGYNVGTLYHHLNLGWAGYSDAYYNLPIIDTGVGTFTSVYKCIYNVFITGTGEIISGRVTDTLGVPLSGATVTAIKEGGSSYSDTTDAQGIYALVGVPSASAFTVSVVKPGFTFTNQTCETLLSRDYFWTSGNVWGVNFAGGSLDRLNIQSVAFDDTDLGNGNGFLDPGETIHETVVLINPSFGPFTNITSVLSTTTPGVTLLQTNSTYPDLAVGDAASNTTALTYRLAKTMTGGTTIQFVQISQANGRSFTNAFSHAVGELFNYPAETNWFNSADTPIVLLDPGTIESDIAVNLTGLYVIDDVDVAIRIDHTWDADLILEIQHPDATKVLLGEELGTNGDGFGTGTCGIDEVRTIFDDEASLAITSGTAPFTNSYRPEELLGSLDGKPLAGTWTFKVTDIWSPDTGTLRCWGLRLAYHQQEYLYTIFNHAPTAIPQSRTGAENTAINLTLSGSDLDADPLSYAVVEGPSHGSLSGTPPNLVYTPATGYYGQDGFTFRVNDGMANSSPAAVTLTLTGVNDVPSFVKGTNIVLAQSTGPRAYTAWASGISPGPDEDWQELDFQVTADLPLLFSVPPALSAQGKLTFTPASGRRGVATIAVALHDNGGTQNGGQDTSPTQTFTVTLGLATDTDGDGLPNDWESTYGFNPSVQHDVDLDTDGDGITDVQEYLCGTHPRNGSDSLKISEIKEVNGQLTVCFLSVPGKQYQLQRNDLFPADAWEPVQDPFMGTGATMEVIDPGADGFRKGVYRIVVIP